MTVAALFVQSDGVYSMMKGVDPWTEKRDARTYQGPHPVVAHPPCATWGRYHQKCGGLGNDSGCFESALSSVRRFGGVLEHPATSKAWARFGMPMVTDQPDRFGGWSIVVHQRWWGHEAIKPTLLYIVGCRQISLPCCDLSGVRPLEHMSKRERSATPPRFALWLVDLARRCVA